jgi:2-polyprenyl-3-methyl-5-hydroxy-6-metoxy-1,4-benzoquinol methylase
VTATACWCGARELAPYSPDYRRCEACGTLSTAAMPSGDIARVRDDGHDLYGHDYWFGHQSQDFGYPDIDQRARADLPERCMHWLRALLRYKLPPATVLEVGAAHGGFVALLRQAGFDATGLELSPAIVERARRTFGVPMLQGVVEDQTIPPGSLDVVALFDVLEHLQDPPATLRHCLELLKPDGFLLIQTPKVPPGARYEDLVARQDPFLAHFKKEEHLFLFTEEGVRELFRRVGATEIAFLPAIFAHYDMFFAASRRPLVAHGDDEIAAALRSPGQRLALALVDLHAQLQQSEADRAARLRVIQDLDSRVRTLEAGVTTAGPGHTHGRWIRALARLVGIRDSGS